MSGAYLGAFLIVATLILVPIALFIFMAFKILDHVAAEDQKRKRNVAPITLDDVEPGDDEGNWRSSPGGYQGGASYNEGRWGRD